MIQRVQSIFLFFVAVCMLLVLYFPLWEKVSVEQQEVAKLTAYSLTHYAIDTTDENIPPKIIGTKMTVAIAILAILAAITAITSIFQYKNRLTQMKLGALNSLFMAATLGFALYYVTYTGESLVEPQEQGAYKLGFFLPAIALVLNTLSNRFIRRDENLVRSVDRIR